MNEEPKSIWKKTWKGSSWLIAWLILIVATMLIVVVINQFLPRKAPFFGTVAIGIVIGLIMATFFIGLWAFIRWLCCWKNFRRFAFVCACLATLVALAYAEEDWRGKHEWNKFKAEWEAKGEKLDWPSVIPAPVPDDQNFALAPIWVESVKAQLGPIDSRQWFGDNYAENGRTNFVNRLDIPVTLNYEWPTNGDWRKAMLIDLKPWQDYYRKLAATTNLFPVSPEPQTPAQDVLLALSKYDPVVEELRADAAARPDCRFPLDYNREDTWQILLPHLAMLKSMSRLLELRAVAELQSGQSDQALSDIKLSFRLIDCIRTEPFLISHLVRIAMFQITLQPVYEGLAEHRWSGAQLVELDSELAKFDFLADCQSSMRGERGLEISAIEGLEHADRRQLNELLLGNNGDMNPVAYTVFSLIPNGWLYQNELTVCRFQVKWYLPMVDETNRTVSPAQVRAARNALARETRRRTPENFWMAWLLPDLTGAVQKFAYAQESADLARVAIALERYRQGAGVYPESLDVLAPNLIDKIPHDIVGGQPLHYQRTSDGKFILYSVGWNGHDDGGVVGRGKNSTVDVNTGDWVWRYPAQ